MEVSYDGTIGAVYIGIVISTCLYGVTCLQFYTYWNKYTDDSTFRRVYVLALWILDTLKLACASSTGYELLITQFDVIGPAFRGTWGGFLVFGLTAFTTFMVQLTSFFAYRSLSGAFWVNPIMMRLMAGLIALSALTQLAFGMATTVLSWQHWTFDNSRQYRWVAVVWLGAAAFCDLLTTYTLSVVLISQKTGFQRTDDMINRIIMYTINTGTLTSTVAIINLALFSSLDNLAQLGLNFILGTLYISTMLTALNSRPSHSPNFAICTLGDGHVVCEPTEGTDTIRFAEQGIPVPMTKLGDPPTHRRVASTDVREAQVPDTHSVISIRSFSELLADFREQTKHAIELSGNNIGRNKDAKDSQEDDDLESIDARSELGN
ncbi:hypothetical protein RhiTH_010628 [Rhizoctonia solani]